VIGEGKVPSVVLGDGLAFTSGGWGGKETMKAFRLGGKGDLKEANLVWEQKKGMPKVPSMLYLKPHLFAITDGGVASCMKADTGELVWQERVGGNFSASPVAAEGRIYFLGDNGETTVIAASSEFKVLAKNPLGEKVQASPAISRGQFFIRTEKNLYCIGDASNAAVASPASADIVGHWKFDESPNTSPSDSSGGKHDGKLLPQRPGECSPTTSKWTSTMKTTWPCTGPSNDDIFGSAFGSAQSMGEYREAVSR